MSLLTHVPFKVDRQALFQRLHIEENSEYASDILKLADMAEKSACPKAIYDTVAITAKDVDGIHLGNVRFTSPALAITLQNSDRIFPYVCTCGVELDEIPIEEDDLFGRFGLDVIKEMALYRASEALRQQVRKEFGIDKIAGMNPGSGDTLLWPIQEQRPLFDLLGNVRQDIGVTLTDSFLMTPNKSVSGFFFKTDKEYHNCQLCKRPDCPNRRSPFDSKLWNERMGGFESPC
jgi:hypothetical protein